MSKHLIKIFVTSVALFISTYSFAISSLPELSIKCPQVLEKQAYSSGAVVARTKIMYGKYFTWIVYTKQKNTKFRSSFPWKKASVNRAGTSSSLICKKDSKTGVMVLIPVGAGAGCTFYKQQMRIKSCSPSSGGYGFLCTLESCK